MKQVKEAFSDPAASQIYLNYYYAMNKIDLLNILVSFLEIL